MRGKAYHDDCHVSDVRQEPADKDIFSDESTCVSSGLACADLPPNFSHDHVPLQPRHPLQIAPIKAQVVRRVVVPLCEHQLS